MEPGKLLYLFAQGFFLGCGPCLATCAPILLPYAGTRKSWREGLASALSFSLGRVIVYVALGSIFGYFGAYILRYYYSSGIDHYIRTALSALIVLTGLAVISGRELDIKFCRVAEGNMVLMGVLVGLSPCVPLIGVMTEIALFSKGLFSGAVYSLFFGIGTVISPMLLMGALAPSIGGAISRRFARAFAVVCGILLVFIGLYLFIK
jgi:sulfite exporter TauE/SafE